MAVVREERGRRGHGRGVGETQRRWISGGNVRVKGKMNRDTARKHQGKEAAFQGKKAVSSKLAHE